MLPKTAAIPSVLVALVSLAVSNPARGAGDAAQPSKTGDAHRQVAPLHGADGTKGEDHNAALGSDPAPEETTVATDADAQGADPPSKYERHSWIWRNLTALRYNAIGLINRFATGYRLQLFDRPGVLFEKSFAALLFNNELSPPYTRVGGTVELQPLAVLKLSAKWDFVGAHGAVDMLQTFASPGAEHDDATLEDLRGDNVAATGLGVIIGALLQAKVGPIGARNSLRGHQLRMNSDEPLFYDRTLDVLFPNRGWVLTNDADVLYLFDSGLKIGARHTYTHVFYPEALDMAGGEDNSPTHRLGPVLAYTFFEDPPSAAWNAPTLAFMGQWWLEHRYRTGASTSVALPYLLLAFSQRGTFLP